jgi:hypothetical protein
VAVRQRISILLVLHVAGAGFTIAQTRTVAPSVETIITRMAQARAENRAHFCSYRVTRDYRLFGKERQKSASP